MWKTVWKAARPSLIPILVASANSVARAALAIRCPTVAMPANVCGGVSVRSTECCLGITNVWPRVNGRMSRMAK